MKVRGIGFSLGLVCLLPLGCMYAYTYKSTVGHDFDITGIHYDEAYAKSIFVLSEMDYQVTGQKDSGTIQANRRVAGGFGTTTTISCLLTQLEPRKHRLNFKIKSSDAYQPIVDRFEARAKQHMTIVVVGRDPYTAP